MVAKMDKADKKYECKDLGAIDWDRIKSITKKPIPTFAKTTIAQIVKQTTAKKYKEPYVKLGLVDGDTVLRVKDGTKHIKDIILVEADEKTVDAPKLTTPQEKLVDQYRNAYKKLDLDMKSFLGEFTKEVDKVELLLSRVETDAVSVSMQPIEIGRGVVSEIQKRLQQAEDILVARQKRLNDDVKIATMDPHRTKAGKPDDSLPKSLIADLAKEKLPVWNKANTRWAKLAGMVTQIENKVKTMRILARNAQNSLGRNTDKKTFWKDLLSDTILQLDSEVKAVEHKLTAKNNAPQLLNFIETIMERLLDPKTTNQDKMNGLDNCTEQVKLVHVNGKVLHAAIKSIRTQVQATLNQIPKPQLEDPEFKRPRADLAALFKTALTYGKQWDEGEEAGMKAFKKMTALVGTDKGAAAKLLQEHAKRVEKRKEQTKKNIDKENKKKQQTQK